MADDTKLLRDVESKVALFQLHRPKRPEIEVSMPEDITRLTSEELSALMGRYAALIAYGRDKAAQTDTLRVGLEAKWRIERAKHYLIYRDDNKLTEKEREYRLELNKDVGAAKRAYVEAEQVYTLTEALLSGYNSCYQALSRELSRRGINAERGYA